MYSATSDKHLSCSPLARQYVPESGPRYEMIVALEPLISLLSDERRVMTGLEGALVIYNSEQRVSVVAERPVFAVLREAVDCRTVVIAVSPM